MTSLNGISSQNTLPVCPLLQAIEKPSAKETAAEVPFNPQSPTKVTTSKTPSASNVVGQQPPPIAAIIMGTSPGILHAWDQDGMVQGLDFTATKAFFQRMATPAAGVSEDLLEALEALIEQRDHPNIEKHAATLRGWTEYLDLVSNPTRERLFHFNMHEVPGVSSLPGVENYGIRSLAMQAGKNDVSVVPDSTPRWAIETVGRYRRQAGLPMGKMMSLSTYNERRSEADAHYNLQEFYRTEKSPNKKHYNLQEVFENKNMAMAYLEASGVAVPKLLFAGKAGSVDRDAFRSQIPVVLKAVRSAGGAGVTLCKSVEAFEAALATYSASDEIQIQEMVRGKDCSKQYFFTDFGPVPISNTDQIIKNGVSHAGNKVMSQLMDDADNRNSDRAAWAIWATGYRGYGAMDLMKPEDGGVARVIEANLRMGGVTMPTATANLLGASEFVAKQLFFESREHLEAFAEMHALRDGDREGVLINSLMPLEKGRVKAEILCVSPTGGRDVATRASQFVERTRALIGR